MEINRKSFIIVLILIAATVAAFFSGGYHTLSPIFFIAGLSIISAVSLWAALRMKTREILTLTTATIAIAAIDEYLHVSTGTYIYFDRGVPSLLSVFGWGLLMIFIVVVARRLSKFLPWKKRMGILGILPPLIAIILLPVFAWIQGYVPLLEWPVIVLYIILSTASIFYGYKHTFGWTLSLMVSGIVIGAGMEASGSLEGMWFFHFQEPLPLFMICVWALRTLTVHASCYLLGIDFAKEGE